MSYTITVNYEIQSGATSPMPLATYVHEVENNPTIIEANGTATLNFVADGLYYSFLKAKALAAKVSGASFTWTSNEPYTTGTLVLSEPTDNVVITLRAKVGVLPQEVTRPFLLQKNFPVDTRLVLSKKEMAEIIDTAMPDTYFALCKDDGHFYLYNKASKNSVETGKFTIITDLIQSFDCGEII